MLYGKKLTVIGIMLIVFAWFSALEIPEEAHKDFRRLVRASGGALSHTPNFRDLYFEMSAKRRLLQNIYIGAT